MNDKKTSYTFTWRQPYFLNYMPGEYAVKEPAEDLPIENFTEANIVLSKIMAM